VCRSFTGYGGRVVSVPRGCAVANPAFDFTPRRYLPGPITVRGVATPRSVMSPVI